MRNRKALVLLVLLVPALALLTGCTPRAGAGEVSAAAGDAALALDLPAIVIDYDAEGKPSIGGVALDGLAGLIPADTLAQLQLPKETIDSLTAANIQHLQINNRLDGLSLYLNGQEIPSLRWNAESLNSLAGLAAQLPNTPPALQTLLPVLTDLGVGVIVRFPAAQGAEMIPTLVEGDDTIAAAAARAQEEFIGSVGTPPQISVPVAYDAEGSWTVGGMTDSEWANLAPGVPWDALRLPASLLENVAKAGVKEATIYTTADGIHLALNGTELPYIAWDGGKLAALIDTAVQSGALGDGLAASGMSSEDLTTLITTLLPALQAADVSFQVTFPE